MRKMCSECGGPMVMCQLCHHAHCDDDTCSAMPTACAMWVQQR